MATHATRSVLVLLLMYFLGAVSAVRLENEALADIATLANVSGWCSLCSSSLQSWCLGLCKLGDVYEVGERIGDGGFGYVLAARKIGGQEYDLAVKQIEGRYRPVEEEIMGLKLPFVAGIVAKFDSYPVTSLVMRRYESDVSKYIGEYTSVCTRVNYLKMKSWAAQMAYGLFTMHRKGILYLDLKLENTFIVDNKSNQVVLGDLGLAETVCQHTRCEEGSVGTVYYNSPAMVAGGVYGYEADWWAHAVAVFTMATGRKPFDGTKRQEVEQAITSAKSEDIFSHLQKEAPETYNELHVEHLEMFQYLEKIIDKDKYYKLNRAEMIGRASEHPLLRDKFWVGSQTDPSEIDKHWLDLCQTFAVEEHRHNCV
eukprot:TRINITY_DN8300_c0_g1_i1.p1 TRINITY_DN8300_c0_g1~~TRINITY_DN8300_c0_g1_i1.p1  ORF type:complete len:369 (+),score=32.87 TRINITY_DN8300_c0_g1_i1:83-1189(+)